MIRVFKSKFVYFVNRTSTMLIFRYKEKLLGEATNVIIDPNSKERVLVKSISLLFEDPNMAPLSQELPPGKSIQLSNSTI